MKTLTTTAALLIGAAALSACAKQPSAIEATPAPAGLFAGLDCAGAAAQLDRLDADLEDLEDEQRRTATADALGVWFLLLPVGSLTGGDQAAAIAAAKGEVAALEAKVAACRAKGPAA